MNKIIINFDKKELKGYCKGKEGFKEQIRVLKKLLLNGGISKSRCIY